MTDSAKNIFQTCDANAAGAVIFRRKLRRPDLAFFAAQPPRVVAMEARLERIKGSRDRRNRQVRKTRWNTGWREKIRVFFGAD